MNIVPFSPYHLIEKANGIKYLYASYASLDKYPYVRAVVGQVNCVLVLNAD